MSERVEYRNECGCFTVNEEGLLLGFAPETENRLNHAHFLPIACSRAVIDLHIPEGVRAIGRKTAGKQVENFRDTLILGEVTFPRSLVAIGEHAFSGSIISRIVFPSTLRQIGCGSFLGSLIHSLTVEKEILQYLDQDLSLDELEESDEKKLIFGGRSFKESTVGEVCLQGKAYARFTPANLRLGMPERRQSLNEEDWVRCLMPEAEVLRVLK